MHDEVIFFKTNAVIIFDSHFAKYILHLKYHCFRVIVNSREMNFMPTCCHYFENKLSVAQESVCKVVKYECSSYYLLIEILVGRSSNAEKCAFCYNMQYVLKSCSFMVIDV